jgi:tRNA nucleotidyltransferase (CCA-adding enzyme)
MPTKTQNVIKNALEKIKVQKEVEDYIRKELTNLLNKIKKRIEKTKIEVEPFVGGSFAKGTLIKSDSYDVDLFLRFDKKYNEKDYTKLTKKILKKTKKTSIVHGSRDYFQIKINPWFKIEVVPVKKVNKSKDAENITDLSFSHVGYIRKKIKSQIFLDEIKLGKAFCHATKTYGAESYVNGFSGYAIELLIYHYKTFEKFLKELTKKRQEKLIIDIEKLYKNKKEILFEMNGSKLISPIILIDPTFKERNALAALSEETLQKFIEEAKLFLKNPSISFFEKRKIDLEKSKEESIKKGKEFLLLKTKTKKQRGDIAGTKLLKFHKHLIQEFSRYFSVKKEGFMYGGKQEGIGYFILEKKQNILFEGPPIKNKINADKFKKEHPNYKEKKGKLFSIKENKFNSKTFLNYWKSKNKKRTKEMYISKIKSV